MNIKKNAAILVSGGGTNLQAIIDADKRGDMPHVNIALVVSSCKNAYAIERAKKYGIQTVIIDSCKKSDQFDAKLIAVLHDHNIDVVVLAGFLVILGNSVIQTYSNRIINVHPSLIPSFCGEGFYGLHVHRAALKRGVKVTGATVHLVNKIVDGGKIILQKSVDVLEDDTPETLQRRVMENAEWVLLPQAIELLCCKP
ncbi:MAG: phosphoribosylglycinamide formyltransferase [Termitinemataceae bacterium]|nr:MAG: phosphoribosylglycinamide formyltransferase [Termitinemataceae bacterium]